MKELILVDGIVDFKIINRDLFQNDSTVVSFDFDAHKSLDDNKIKHILVEDYFSEKDKLELDELSLKFTTSWHKDKKIEKWIEFENLNLGSLLELEMPIYFFKVLKRIIGVKKVLEKENPDKIISYSLKKYVEHICNNRKIKVKFFDKNIATGLHFDKMTIPLKLGFMKKNLKISRKYYFKIKNIVDKILNLIWKINPSEEKIRNKESILLLDFSTKIYEDFLKKNQTDDKNIIILNQRKPAIWNFETLNIIKNSKCKVLSIKNFENSQTKNKNITKQYELNRNLKLMWNDEKTLKIIFTHNGESFWEIIKNDFSKLITKRFSESIERLILINEMFDKMKIELVVDWAHTGMEEKEISYVANKKKISIFCLQHGTMTLNPKFEKYHPLMPVLPSNNSQMLVWGEIMKSYLLEHKVNPNDITIVGSPRHDRFFKKKMLTNDNTVLIASNLFFPYNFDGNDTRAYDRYVLYIKEILEFIKKNSNKTPIIKLHQAEYFDISSIVKKIDPSIIIYQYEDVLELLEKCDVLISLNYSTILVDALILNKPSMVILAEKQNYEEEEIIKRNAVLAVSDISELETKLKQILFENNTRKNLVLNGKKFVEDYFSYKGNSSEYLIKWLLNTKEN